MTPPQPSSTTSKRPPPMLPPDAAIKKPLHRRLSWTRSIHLPKRQQLRRYFLTDDYKLNFNCYKYLHKKYGPFTCDGACDDEGLNKHHATWYSPSRSFLKAKFSASDNVYCNPPFSKIDKFLDHYFSSKHPATKGCFILPRWPNQPWYSKYIGNGLRRVHTYRKGYDLFTTPNPIPGKPAHRVFPGPTRWHVDVYINDKISGNPVNIRLVSKVLLPTTTVYYPFRVRFKPPKPSALWIRVLLAIFWMQLFSTIYSQTRVSNFSTSRIEFGKPTVNFLFQQLPFLRHSMSTDFPTTAPSSSRICLTPMLFSGNRGFPSTTPTSTGDIMSLLCTMELRFELSLLLQDRRHFIFSMLPE